MTTYVYVISDANSDPLYVGHTRDLPTRLDCHAHAEWGHRASKLDVTMHADKEDALEFERNLIADLEPEFNVQGNLRHLSAEDFMALLLHDAESLTVRERAA